MAWTLDLQITTSASEMTTVASIAPQWRIANWDSQPGSRQHICPSIEASNLTISTCSKSLHSSIPFRSAFLHSSPGSTSTVACKTMTFFCTASMLPSCSGVRVYSVVFNARSPLGLVSGSVRAAISGSASDLLKLSHVQLGRRQDQHYSRHNSLFIARTKQV